MYYSVLGSSRFSVALVSAIILGVALVISLVGLATVTMMKTKQKIQARAMNVTLDKIPSRKAAPKENRSDITTNKNVSCCTFTKDSYK